MFWYILLMVAKRVYSGVTPESAKERKNRSTREPGGLVSMGKETSSRHHRNEWKCPQFPCDMSSNRRWNVERHIQRIHYGIGIPFSRDDPTSKVYNEHADQRDTWSPAFLAELWAASQSPNQKHEEHRDPIDRILPYLRKYVDFRNLSRDLFSRPQGFPLNPRSLDSFNSSAFHASYGPAFSQGFSVIDEELEIFGYRGYTCGICLMNFALAVYARKYNDVLEAHNQQGGLQTIPAVHRCNVQRAVAYSSLPVETRNKIFTDLLKNLPVRIMTSVKSWTKNQSGLFSFEMKPYDVYKNFSSDLFPNDENHWSIRTIKNRKTTFKNDEEMMDFIRSANSSTAGLFNVRSQSQENGYKSAYFVMILPIDTASLEPIHSNVV